MEKITDLILENESLIYKIIGKYSNYFELDDLYQVAVMGIIKAYKNYNEKYNTKFTTYAYPYILGEVIKYINDSRSIKINRTTRMLYYKILKAKEVLSQKLMKEPTTYELSLYLEIDESTINEICMATMTVDSLDKIISEDDKKIELYDKLGYIDPSIENCLLSQELSKLTPLEQTIIRSRYYENMSQKEVGNNLGMYQVEVSRQEKKILKKLRDNIAA